MLFKDLQLNSNLLRAVEAAGYDKPTDIQREAIPVILSGKDLMASAQTGTGKTAAFVLPALQKLLEPSKGKGKGPRVLILTPTRELATQVNDNIVQYGKFCRFTTGSVVGGMPYPPQMKMLRNPLDLLVATPGRLMDHMDSGRIDFSRLEFLVLDEADRMLDMGFVDAVNAIADATPESRQTLLFSATLEGRVLQVAKKLLKDPVRVQLAANSESHASIEQQVHQADDIRHKHSLLSHYIDQKMLSQAVIFTATKRGADRLAKTLSAQGHASAPLHGDMNQNQRKRTVERMRRGNVRLLVATDVAARGLDIKGISHVINFDMPMVAEDYIHRIGRTGRGGAKGTAVSLVGPDDWSKLAGIERLTGSRLKRDIIEGMEPSKPEPRSGSGRGRPGGGGYRGKPGGAGAKRNGAPRWTSRKPADAARGAKRAAGKPASREANGNTTTAGAGNTNRKPATHSAKRRGGPAKSGRKTQHYPSGPMFG